MTVTDGQTDGDCHSLSFSQSQKDFYVAKIQAIERILTAFEGEWSSAASGGGRWTPAPSVWAS